MIAFLRRALVSAFAVLFLIASATFGVEAVWIGGPTGNWSDPANWSTGVVPRIDTINVTIDANSPQDTVVALDRDATIQNLLVDVGDTLNIDRAMAANSTTLAGNVNFAASGRFHVADFFWIQPTGVLTSAAGSIFGANTNDGVLWNQGRIEGAGNSSPGFVVENEGVIAANVPGGTLALGFKRFNQAGAIYNAGELIAENGGTLSLNKLADVITLENYRDDIEGVIEARGDSTVDVGINVVGGVLRTSSAGGVSEGTIHVGSALLQDLRIEGNVHLDSVSIKGTIVNNSTPVFTGPPSKTELTVADFATLAGQGRIDLRGGGIYVGGIGKSLRLTNAGGHTIAGPGAINSFSLHNQGLIENDRQTLTMTLHATDAWTNTGAMRAREGGTLQIAGYASQSSPMLDNTGGVIEADVGSTISLNNMTLRGGVLRSVPSPAGTTAMAGRVTAATGLLKFAGLESLKLEGPIGDVNSYWQLGGEIENTGLLMARQVNVEKDTHLTGGGELRLSELRGPSTANLDREFVNEDNTIGGAGIIEPGHFLLINRGTIQADISNQTLRLDSTSTPKYAVVNRGTLQAINGAHLRLYDQIENRDGDTLGTIRAGDSSEVLIMGTIVGGNLTTEGTGKLVAGGNAELVNVHLDGQFYVETFLRLGGRIVNDGSILDGDPSPVYVDGPVVELTGSGTWGVGEQELGFTIGSISRSIFIHGGSHTIHGGGQIVVNSGALINHGTIIAEGPSSLRLTLEQGATMSQEGTILVPDGESFVVEMRDDRFTNKGTFDAVGDVTIKRLNAGRAEFVNAAGAYIGLIGAIHLEPGSGTPSPPGEFWNQAGATLAGKGELDLIRDGSANSGLFRNSGLLRPEGEVADLGRIFLDGDFQQEATGAYEVTLAGIESGEFDAMILSGGNAVLGGALEVRPIPTYDPQVGHEFAILDTQGGTITGTFDTFTAPALSGRWWSLEYQTDKVLLSVNPITADFDGNGIVDYFDLASWQAAYGVDAAGDADGDGDTDGRDYLLWQRELGSGVPVSEIASVPEPGTGIVLIIASLVGLSPRREFC